MPRRTMRTLVIICCTLIIPGVAHAQDPVEKVGRGLTNVLSGWIELPKQIHLGLHSDHPVAGVGWGLVKGTGLAVMPFPLHLFEPQGLERLGVHVGMHHVVDRVDF